MENSKALEIIEKYRNDRALVYVRPEDLNTQKMFIPQITVIPAIPEDFHEKPISGKMMPKGHHVDRIGEAAGIKFISEGCGTHKAGPHIWVGRAIGKRRMPDGTWRESTPQEYEFDADVRAKLETGLKEGPKFENKVDELCKFGRQRASTGARLRVIRELTGIPIAFGKEDFQRAIVVSRIDINSDAMLEDPEMRQAAIAYAVGAQQALFGPQSRDEVFARDVTPEPPALPEPEPADNTEGDDLPDVPDEPDLFGGKQDVTNPDPVTEKKAALEEWLASGQVTKPNNVKGIRELIDNPKATAEECGKVLGFLQEQFGGAA